MAEVSGSGLERTKGHEMTLDLFTATIAAVIFIGSFITLGIAALGYGVDSRPGIDDRGSRRWMPGS
jgi:hypothetical protein